MTSFTEEATELAYGGSMLCYSALAHVRNFVKISLRTLPSAQHIQVSPCSEALDFSSISQASFWLQLFASGTWEFPDSFSFQVQLCNLNRFSLNNSYS